MGTEIGRFGAGGTVTLVMFLIVAFIIIVWVVQEIGMVKGAPDTNATPWWRTLWPWPRTPRTAAPPAPEPPTRAHTQTVGRDLEPSDSIYAEDPLAPKYGWTGTIIGHGFGAGALVTMIGFWVGAPGFAPTVSDEYASYVVLCFFILIGYCIWLSVSYWPRNLAPRYRWYWLRPRDARVVSAPVAPYPSVFQDAEDLPARGTAVLRRKVSGMGGSSALFHERDAVSAAVFRKPLLWQVESLPHGELLILTDGFGSRITVTPPLALRIASDSAIVSYLNRMDARLREVGTMVGRGERLRTAAASIAKVARTLQASEVEDGLAFDQKLHALEEQVGTALGDGAPNASPAPAASAGAARWAPYSAQLPAEGQQFRLGWVILGHMVGAIAAYASWGTYVMYVPNSMWWIIWFVPAMAFGVPYLIWLVFYIQWNLIPRFRWFWVQQNGAVTASHRQSPDGRFRLNQPPAAHPKSGSLTLRVRHHGIFGRSELIPEDEIEKPRRERSSVLWRITAAKPDRVTIRDHLGRVAALPPAVAIRILDTDGANDLIGILVQCEVLARATPEATVAVEAIRQRLSEIRAALTTLRQTDPEVTPYDPEVVQSELNVIAVELESIARPAAAAARDGAPPTPTAAPATTAASAPTP